MLLSDHRLALPPACPDSLSADEWDFFETLEGIDTSGCSISSESSRHIYDELSRHGYPDDPRLGLSREIARPLTTILLRILGRHSTSVAPVSTVSPLAKGLHFTCHECKESFQADLNRAFHNAAWSLVSISPDALNIDAPIHPALNEIPLVCPLDIDAIEKRVALSHNLRKALRNLSDRRALIIGGQENSQEVSRLENLLGSPGCIEWLPSEKQKPPRNLGPKIGEANRDRLVIVITGRIGHATSGKVKQLVESCGADLYEFESFHSLSSQLVIAELGRVSERNPSE